MTEPTVAHSTFAIERSYPRTPDAVFSAFADPSIKRRWYAEGGGPQVIDYALDFREGGSEHTRYKMGDTSYMPGAELGSDVIYADIQSNRRIVFSQTMSMAGRRFSASLVTIELLAQGEGTVLVLTHQGAFFEGADGPEMREHGWRILLGRLDGALDA